MVKKEEVIGLLNEFDVAYSFVANPHEQVAQLLANGKIICRYANRMEFGPRALGNRSILADATFPGVQDRLNEKLNRSDFMPFAPAILEEFADEHFYLRGAERAAKFMTITCTAKKATWSKYPTVIHVDGTARPQIVKRETDSDFHDLLSAYYRQTGHPLILNTSFNMHEEPIVATAFDALRTFVKSELDVLYIDDLIITRGDIKHLKDKDLM